MSVRIYLPAGSADVARLRAGDGVEATAFVVTDAMRAADPRADEDDLEYEACRSAEDAARAAGGPVVVIAADVASVGEPDGQGRVEVGVVPLTDVVAFHVEERDAAEDTELLWYDASEIDDVHAYLSDRRPT